MKNRAEFLSIHLLGVKNKCRIFLTQNEKHFLPMTITKS
jgi:predicted nucleotidyltransferase